MKYAKYGIFGRRCRPFFCLATDFAHGAPYASSFGIVVLGRVLHHAHSAHHFDEYYIASDFDDVIPRNEQVVGRGETLEKALFPRHDKPEYSAAGGENHIAGVPELSPVGDIHHLFCRQFRKRILLDIHIEGYVSGTSRMQILSNSLHRHTAYGIICRK